MFSSYSFTHNLNKCGEARQDPDSILVASVYIDIQGRLQKRIFETRLS